MSQAVQFFSTFTPTFRLFLTGRPASLETNTLSFFFPFFPPWMRVKRRFSWAWRAVKKRSMSHAFGPDFRMLCARPTVSSLRCRSFTERRLCERQMSVVAYKVLCAVPSPRVSRKKSWPALAATMTWRRRTTARRMAMTTT